MGARVVSQQAVRREKRGAGAGGERGVLVSECLLPSLQLARLVHLEADWESTCQRVTTANTRRERTDPWSVPFRLQRRLGSTGLRPTTSPDRLSPRQPPSSSSRRTARRHALSWHHVRIDHVKHVREGRAKVSPVDGAVARGFGRVDVFAAGAVEFDGFLVGRVGEADGEEGVAVAEHARASTKVGLFVLFELRETMKDQLWAAGGEREGDG